MSIPLKVLVPQGLQHYDCSGCGDCCRGRFAIIVTPDDKARIDTQGWTADELNLNGKPLFTPVAGGDFHLAHDKDGTCVFLSPDNKCRIHAKFGEAAKPVACRLYPFTFVPTGREARVDVRFDCPSTAGNTGRPISAHRAELQTLVGGALPPEASTVPPPTFSDKVTLTWEQLLRVTQGVERVLSDVSLSLTRRVGASVQWIELMRDPRLGELTLKELGQYADAAAAQVQEDAGGALLDRVEPAGAARTLFRQLAGLYGRYDRVGERADVAGRLNVSVRMLAGKGNVPKLRDGFPEGVPFAQLEQSCAVKGDAAAVLERYLHTHLMSMGFCGRAFYGRGYLDGLSALLLTYPLCCWFARAFAASEGMGELSVSHAERALMVVDHLHGASPLLNAPSERQRASLLCAPDTLCSLVVWYGS